MRLDHGGEGLPLPLLASQRLVCVHIDGNLVHASRLVAIGEMAAGIAHDISNPLAVVMMSLQMSGRKLKKNGEPTPEAIRRWPCGASITGPARTL